MDTCMHLPNVFRSLAPPCLGGEASRLAGNLKQFIGLFHFWGLSEFAPPQLCGMESQAFVGLSKLTLWAV